MINENDEKETLSFNDIDILCSIGFDLKESIDDLIYSIKKINIDVENIKKYLNISDK